MHDVCLDERLWETIEAGQQARVERWLVTEGEHVVSGQVLAQVRLLNAQVDVAASRAGVVEAILVAPGEGIGHGTVLARVVPL